MMYNKDKVFFSRVESMTLEDKNKQQLGGGGVWKWKCIKQRMK